METLPIHDAQSRLPELVEKAEAGEKIVLTRDGAAVAEITPLHPLAPAPGPAKDSISVLLGKIADRARAQPGAGAEVLRLLQEMRDEAR